MATSTVSIWQNTINSLVELIELFGQSIELQTRDIAPLKSGNIDPDVTFVTFDTVLGAFDTKSGQVMFDGVSIDDSKEQIIYIEYNENVTSSTWILYNNQRLDIKSVQDIGSLNGIMEIKYVNRGSADDKASQA